MRHRFINSLRAQVMSHPACSLQTTPFFLCINFWHCQVWKTFEPPIRGRFGTFPLDAKELRFVCRPFWSYYWLTWGSDFDPHPQPQNSLLMIFRLQPGLEWKFLLRRTWSGRNRSHCNFQDFHSLSKENQISWARTFLLPPRFRK